MKERPILFSAPMVQAIRAGRKTQTRRVVKNQNRLDFLGGSGDDKNDPSMWGWRADGNGLDEYVSLAKSPDCLHYAVCPYGVPGDRLWVKEAYRLERKWDTYAPGDVLNDILPAVWYEAEERSSDIEVSPWGKLRPSIHMPRRVSRILLEVVSVRVERVQAISEADAKAEGVAWGSGGPLATVLFEALWKSINGAHSWVSNPWVWVVEFKVIGGAA